MIKSDLRITISNHCKINCNHCYIPIEQRKEIKIINKNEINELINDYKYINTISENYLNIRINKQLIIFGGEIFDLPIEILKTKLLEIIEIINKNNLSFDVLTLNTSLMFNYKNNIKEVFEILNKNFHKIVISFSYEKENRFKSKLEFENFLNNIKLLNQNFNFDYNLTITLTKNLYLKKEESIKEIQEIKKLFKNNLNIKFNVLEHLYLKEKTIKKLYLDDEKIEKIFLELNFLSSNNNIDKVYNDDEENTILFELENITLNNINKKLFSIDFNTNDKNQNINTILKDFNIDYDNDLSKIKKLILYKYIKINKNIK